MEIWNIIIDVFGNITPIICTIIAIRFISNKKYKKENITNNVKRVIDLLKATCKNKLNLSGTIDVKKHDIKIIDELIKLTKSDSFYLLKKQKQDIINKIIEKYNQSTFNYNYIFQYQGSSNRSISYGDNNEILYLCREYLDE